MSHSDALFGHVQESKDLQKQYNAIAAFFSGYSLSSARRVMAKSLKVAGGGYVYKANPANTLYFFQLLENLVLAAISIYHSGCKRETAIIKVQDTPPDLTNYDQYFGWNRQCSPWYFFPRHLTAKEYFNPYIGLAKLAKLGTKKEWKDILGCLLTDAITNYPLSITDNEYNLIEIYLILNKAIECCHLIEVRAITETQGRPVPKWKGQTPGNTLVSDTS